jgi:glutamate 5-kinase
MKRTQIKTSQRIVVKIGTSSLTYANGNINLQRMEKLARVLSDLMNQGKHIVLVTSGAIGVGVGKLKLASRPSSTREKQAVAAVGQSELMHLYSKFFLEYGHIVGQILLTSRDVEEAQSRQNLINTFDTLLEKGILPIVNENDSVSTEELEFKHALFSENDTLSAIVASLISADTLILLSDIDGLYDEDPHINPNAQLIHDVYAIDDALFQHSTGITSNRGTGGMTTKLRAAQIATEAGINMLILQGENPELLYDALDGAEIGTLFYAKDK